MIGWYGSVSLYDNGYLLEVVRVWNKKIIYKNCFFVTTKFIIVFILREKNRVTFEFKDSP